MIKDERENRNVNRHDIKVASNKLSCGRKKQNKNFNYITAKN